MKFSLQGQELIALIVAVSFAAGLNVYATVATLGLLAHAGMLPLPDALQPLTSWWVIGASAALFAVEFFADKIPAFDLLWNALHTFIRVPVAALLAWRATATLTPGEQLAASVLGGLIALAAHSGETAARAAVTPSPEPFSNIRLSLGETCSPSRSPGSPRDTRLSPAPSPLHAFSSSSCSSAGSGEPSALSSAMPNTSSPTESQILPTPVSYGEHSRNAFANIPPGVATDGTRTDD